MALRITGSVIGEPITSSFSSATGMWTSQEVAALQKDGIWQVPTSYSLTASASNVNEGSFITATLTTTGLANGTVIPYVITGSNVFANDFTSGNITGNFVIQNNSNTISFTANADLTLEYAETFTITAGTASANIIINDTSYLVDIANVVLLLHGNGTNNSQNNTFLDSSAYSLAVTRNGNSTQGSVNPYGDKWSNYFDESGDYLSIPDDAAFTVGTGDVTLEAWIYWFSSANYQGIVSGRSPASAPFGGLGLVVNSYKLTFSIMNTMLEDPDNIPTNQWVHVVGVRSGTNAALFVNGVRKVFSASNSDNGTSSAMCVGRYYPTLNNYYFGGYISNVRLVKGTAVYNPTLTTLAVPTEPLTAISGTSLLTCQSNRFKDNSANNFIITKNGDTSVQRFSPFRSITPDGYTANTYSGSAYFDGTGDYLTVPGNAAFTLGTASFTVEAWIYPTSAQVVTLVSSNYNYSTGDGNWSLYFIVGSASTIYFNAGNSTGFANHGSSTTVTIPINAWTHIAYSRYGGNGYFYINGVQLGTAVADTSNYAGSSGLLYIGRQNDGTGPFVGYISDFKIIKGTAVYAGNFTPPTAPLLVSGTSSIYPNTANVNTTFAAANTSLLCNFTNAGIIDNAMMNNLETIGDAKISTVQSKFGGTSMYFDGTGDYLFSPGPSQFQNFAFGTGDFTIECWLYQIAFSADMIIIASFATWATSVNFYFGTRAGSPNILIFRGGDSTPILLNGNTGITTNTWTHVAVCRASGVTRMFVGGIAQTATHTGSVNISNTVNTTGIGASNNGTEPMNGYLDDLRITKGFARYTTNFSPPTSEFLDY